MHTNGRLNFAGMLKSMTGYGKAVETVNGKQVTVELRSLNSKYLDLHLKVPTSLREREIGIRSIAQESVQRGKLEVSFSIEEPGNPGNFHVNLDLVRQYHSEVKKIEEELNLPEVDLLSTLLQLPNVVEPVEVPISDGEWKAIEAVYRTALKQFNAFRETEGEKLMNDLTFRVETISKLSSGVKEMDSGRVERIRSRIKGNLDNLINSDKIDQNRFEQEVLYYMEKLDITEELVRLSTHCDHFLESIKEQADQKGKKLGFISQEMGREINTLGSKANDADMQKLVVQMKDHLEKIKEQVLNIL